ncbi:MAG: hypothetical protein LBP22_11425 [Deltaproteobacteria bacterium]|nr:hypothetical protein [Deltaproteobacteria bacterium]
MFLKADYLVQGVMLFLFMASLVTRTVILEKAVALSRFGRGYKSLTQEDLDDPASLPYDRPGSVVRIIAAGIEQTCYRTGRESRSEFRVRA